MLAIVSILACISYDVRQLYALLSYGSSHWHRIIVLSQCVYCLFGFRLMLWWLSDNSKKVKTSAPANAEQCLIGADLVVDLF